MKIKRCLLLLLTLMFISSFNIPFVKASDSATLRFNSDGKFKILVFADCQDNENPYQKMIELMEDALDNEKPDMVVFTGDNVVVGSEGKFRTGASKIIQPLIDRDIPYAYTFGNHDDEKGVSKEYMHSVYSSLGTCLTYDAVPSLNGFGNCNIPIYSSKGNDIAFNLWMIDSLTYADGGYDHVRQDQIDWYKKTSAELEQQAGHKVNSLMFQHIALPEIYNLLTESSTGSKTYLGKRYSLNLNSNATGYLGEFPCPPAVNGGQFDALAERGDVLGVVTGHDHSNAFHGKYKDIGFLQVPGITFESYGDDNCRGYGVIELNEKNTSEYSYNPVSYIDFWNGLRADNTWNDTGIYGGGVNEYISSISIANAGSASTARNNLTSAGYKVIERDLNAGAGGDYIYMGYKTTTDANKALRDIRFYVADGANSKATATVTVNGQQCTYTRVSDIDLNKGAKGYYIYAYSTNDAAAGEPVKAISFGSSPTSSTNKVCGTLGSVYRAAELNKDAGGDYIYCYLTTLSSLDITSLAEKTQRAKDVLDKSVFYNNSQLMLESSVRSAEALIADVSDDGITVHDQSYVDYISAEFEKGFDGLIIQVQFVDYDGDVIESVYANYGSSVACSITPTRESDEQYHYTFSGWDKDTSSVTSSLVFKAQYTAEHYHSSNVPATCTQDEVCRFCYELMKKATGHGASVTKNVVETTCTADGYTGDSCCVDCGEVLVRGETITSEGHKYGDWVYYIMPTVTQTGTDRLTCSVCRQSVYRESPKATTATVNNEFIYGFTSNVSSTQIKNYFNLTYLSVTAQPSVKNTMGTGSVVSVKQKGVATDYTVVIFGDVNGDGWYDGQDAIIVSCLAQGMLSEEDVTPAEYMAADCNHDGVVDVSDVELLNQAGLILSLVAQDKTDSTFEASSAYFEYIDLIEQSPEAESPTVEEESQPEQCIIFDLILRLIAQIVSFIKGYISFI